MNISPQETLQNILSHTVSNHTEPDNKSSKNKESENVVRVFTLDVEVPEFLKNLTPENKEQSVTKLNASEIDNESEYKAMFTKGYYRVSSWASSCAGNNFYRENESIPFFKKIFDTIARETPTYYSRDSLFHGHLVYNKQMDDILIIFHSFEYPSDIEELKSSLASAISSTPEFTTSIEGFKWRNSIYSRNKNTLFIINHEIKEFAPLIYEDITFNQDLCGDKIFDINYFPLEGVEPFFH